MKAQYWLALVILLTAGLATSAQAHIASNGFLTLQVHASELDGAVELAVRDVELAIGVDDNHDGTVTWGELRHNEARLQDYVAAHFSMSAQGSACVLRFKPLQVNERVDGNYAYLPFAAHCPW